MLCKFADEVYSPVGGFKPSAKNIKTGRIMNYVQFTTPHANVEIKLYEQIQVTFCTNPLNSLKQNTLYILPVNHQSHFQVEYCYCHGHGQLVL